MVLGNMRSINNLPRLTLLALPIAALVALAIWLQPTPDAVGSLESSYKPKKRPSAASKLSDREIADEFTIRFLADQGTWKTSTWLGIPAWQNPLDVWVAQEIIFEVKPDYVVETGTLAGGSAALWASILEQVNPNGRVITIDIANHSQKFRAAPILARRVDFLLGSSTAPEIVADVRRRVGRGSAIVILDSLHTKEHVLNELRAYARLVPVGSYVIVQDSVFNGHPVETGWDQEGPWGAIQAFLAETDDFQVDKTRERLMMTFSPNGFLRRVE